MITPAAMVKSKISSRPMPPTGMVNPLPAALCDSLIMTKTIAKKRDAIVAGGTGHRTARAGKGYLSRDVLPVAALRLDSRGGPIASRPDFHFDFLIEFLLVTALLSHSARWQVPGAGAHPASGALTVRLVTVGVN